MKSMNYIFSHRKDCDGIMSAAIYLRSIKNANTYLINYGEEEISRMINIMKEISKNDIGNIVISDFGINRSTSYMIIEEFKELKQKGWSITWIDHHQWPEDLKNEISKYANLIIDTSKCASEIMNATFCNDEICKELASIARDSDFHLNLYIITELIKDIIAYYNYLKNDDLLIQLAHKFSQGILWDSITQKDWETYIIEKKKATTELASNIITKNIKSYKVAIGIASEVLASSDALDIIDEKTKADISIVVHMKGTLTIKRRNGTNILCNKIAEFFDGGGHQFIAGGKLPSNIISKSDKNEWIQYIFTKVEEALTKIQQQ
jgi:oligoribonuclease NrnB/cAMP/cGMP phosphodiesterase (DHH superfamily)